MTDEIAFVTTRAARLVRAQHDLTGARIHDLSLPQAVQAFFEAFVAGWDENRSWAQLVLPGRLSAGGIEIPGGRDSVPIAIGVERRGREWYHYAAFGKFEGPKDTLEWVGKYGTAYEHAPIWSEPAVYAAVRQYFQLENEQFQAIVIKAQLEGRPHCDVFHAAYAAILLKRLMEAEDYETRYAENMARRRPEFRVPLHRARVVLARSEELPRSIWPDVVPLAAIRARPEMTIDQAVNDYLVNAVGMSHAAAARALGRTKGTVSRMVYKNRPQPTAGESSSSKHDDEGGEN